MSVAFDAVGPSSAGASSTASTSLSWSHTCTGSNLVLIAAVAMGASVDTGITTAATYNSVSMTSLGVVHSGTLTAGYIQAWYLIAPATGANTLAITASGGTPGTLAGGSCSFTGADQTTPMGTAFTGHDNNTPVGTGSVSVTGTTSGNMIFSAICTGSGGESATTGTLRWNKFVNGNSAAGSGAMSTIAAPGGTQAMSWSFNTDDWGAIAAEVKAVSGAATPNPQQAIVMPSLAASMAGIW